MTSEWSAEGKRAWHKPKAIKSFGRTLGVAHAACLISLLSSIQICGKLNTKRLEEGEIELAGGVAKVLRGYTA